MSSRTGSNKQQHGGASSAAPIPPPSQDQDEAPQFVASAWNGAKPGFLYGQGPLGEGYYSFPNQPPPTTVRARKRLHKSASDEEASSEGEVPNGADPYVGPPNATVEEGTVDTQDEIFQQPIGPAYYPGLPPAPLAQFAPIPSISEQVSTFVALRQKAEEVRRRNYESTSLLPNYQEQRFHQAVVARLKRGLLASEQKTERFRQEKKRMRKQIEEGTVQNFSLSSLREAPVEAQLSRLSFEELQRTRNFAGALLQLFA